MYKIPVLPTYYVLTPKKDLKPARAIYFSNKGKWFVEVDKPYKRYDTDAYFVEDIGLYRATDYVDSEGNPIIEGHLVSFKPKNVSTVTPERICKVVERDGYLVFETCTPRGLASTKFNISFDAFEGTKTIVGFEPLN